MFSLCLSIWRCGEQRRLRRSLGFIIDSVCECILKCYVVKVVRERNGTSFTTCKIYLSHRSAGRQSEAAQYTVVLSDTIIQLFDTFPIVMTPCQCHTASELHHLRHLCHLSQLPLFFTATQNLQLDSDCETYAPHQLIPSHLGIQHFGQRKQFSLIQD